MRIATGTTATLAAMGIVGFASEASAALVTVTENIRPSTSLPTTQNFIAVDSSTAQFVYASGASPTNKGDGAFALVPAPSTTSSGAESFLGEIANTGVNGSATIDTNPADYPTAPKSMGQEVIMADFTLPGAKTASFTFHGTGFVNLEFTNGAGDTEFGYATFNTSDGTLESITYQTAGSTAAVPESSTWAMLIAGAGVTGLVVHRRRRRSALLAAA